MTINYCKIVINTKGAQNTIFTTEYNIVNNDYFI